MQRNCTDELNETKKRSGLNAVEERKRSGSSDGERRKRNGPSDSKKKSSRLSDVDKRTRSC
jgi:hypothetical protein